MKRPLKKHANVHNGLKNMKKLILLAIMFFSFNLSFGQTFDVVECQCLNNGTNEFNAQFKETVTINSGPGETWILNSTTNFYDASTSPAPPAAPSLFPAFYIIPESSPGVYEVEGLRLEGQDWEIVLASSGTLYPLSSNVSCNSPSNEIEGDFGTCIGTLETYSTAHDADLVQGIFWTVSGGGTIVGGQGTPSIFVDWGDVVGDYDVSFSGLAAQFDGQTEGFCVFGGTESVSVMDEEAFAIACNNQVNISLNGECSLDITPDMLLEDMMFSNDSYDLVITDMDADTIVTGTTLGMEYINMTLQVSVVHECSGNYCWGNILLEDKSIPLLECGGNVVIDCDEVVTPNNTGFPVDADVIVQSLGNQTYNLIGFDKCSDAELTYEDVPASTDLCEGPFSSIIDRTWTATDISGNVTSCTQKIFVNKATIDDITFPENFDDVLGPNASLEACSNYPKLSNGNPSPSFTGSPQGVFCLNVEVDYEDTTLPKCGDQSFKIRRRWTVTDLCTAEQKNHTQYITVVDTQAPVCVAPPEFTVSATNLSCSAIIEVPAPIIVNECSEYTYSVSYKLADENGNPFIQPTNEGVIEQADGTFLITGLDEINGNQIWIVYYITDACGNTTPCFTEATIIDEVQPIPVCDLHTFVGLNENGVGYAGINSFDDGSWDNCGIDYMEIRRTDGFKCGVSNAWSDEVKFCCEDIGKIIMIELRVVDHAGNSNVCTVEAEVQDNHEPEITFCPADVTIDCDDDTVNLDQYGAPLAIDNCNVTISSTVSRSINSCGTGIITRNFRAEDDNGNFTTCVQRIRVRDLDPFYVNPLNPNDTNDDIQWPGNHTVANGCVDSGVAPDDLPSSKQRPVILEEGCAQISFTYDDVVFQYTDEACFKILRTWKVIDDCVYNPLTGVGSWTYTQTIKVENTQAPVITSGCTASDYTITQDANCGARIQAAANASDDCNDVDDLEFTYTIDEDSNGSIDYFGNGRNVDRNVPFGTHRIIWTVVDQCGNVATCAAFVTVDDIKPPTPYCLSEIVTVIMDEDGEAVIWASDFNNGSWDNCTNQDDIIASFSTSTNDISRSFDCDDLEGSVDTFDLQVYFTDLAGNKDFCTTTIIIEDNQNYCGNDDGGPTEGRVALGGQITVANNEEFSGIPISLQSNLPEFPIQTTTSDDGGYSFTDLLSANNYELVPAYDEMHNEGVSTLDLVLIQQHILELKKFDDPYKVIAADINGNEKVTASDLLQLRKLILGIYSELPDNDSWRFVDAAFEFTDANDPFPYDENVIMSNLNEDYMDADFVAVKIGDVNSSAELGLKGGDVSSTRSALSLNVTDQYLEVGRQAVSVSLDDRIDMVGMQLSFNVNEDMVSYVVLGSEQIELTEDQFYFADSKLKASIHSATSTYVKDDVITLIMDVEKAGYLSDMVSLNDAKWNNEIYTQEYNQLEAHNVNLNITPRAGEEVSAFELLQNVPNPFTTTTDIAFILPNTQTVTLQVLDVTGKVLIKRTGVYQKGYNTITLDVSDINASGVMYYQIDTETNSASRKMVIVK